VSSGAGRVCEVRVGLGEGDGIGDVFGISLFGPVKGGGGHQQSGVREAGGSVGVVARRGFLEIRTGVGS